MSNRRIPIKKSVKKFTDPDPDRDYHRNITGFSMVTPGAFNARDEVLRREFYNGDGAQKTSLKPHQMVKKSLTTYLVV